MSPDPKRAAADYLAAVLADPKARPADKLRAAEAILRADAPQTGAGRVTGLMSDADLEAAARGEGGTPPKRGPVEGVTETGPIREGEPRVGERRPSALALQPTVVPNFKRKGGPKGGTPAPESQAPATSPDVDPLS